MNLDLKDYFTKYQPLGPLSSDSITSPLLIESVLSRKNLMFSELGSNPSLIVGRRGAGKTAFLRLAYLNSKSKIIVELKPERTFRHIVESVDAIGHDVVLVEEVCELWSLLFWNTILVSILQEYKEKKIRSNNLNTIEKYVVGGKLADKNPYDVMKTVLNYLENLSTDSESEGFR